MEAKTSVDIRRIEISDFQKNWMGRYFNSFFDAFKKFRVPDYKQAAGEPAKVPFNTIPGLSLLENNPGRLVEVARLRGETLDLEKISDNSENIAMFLCDPKHGSNGEPPEISLETIQGLIFLGAVTEGSAGGGKIAGEMVLVEHVHEKADFIALVTRRLIHENFGESWENPLNTLTFLEGVPQCVAGVGKFRENMVEVEMVYEHYDISIMVLRKLDYVIARSSNATRRATWAMALDVMKNINGRDEGGSSTAAPKKPRKNLRQANEDQINQVNEALQQIKKRQRAVAQRKKIFKARRQGNNKNTETTIIDTNDEEDSDGAD